MLDETCLPQTPEDKSLPNNFQKKPVPKNLKKNIPKISEYWKLYQKIFEDKIRPKYPKKYSPPNNLWREILYQTNFE